MSPLFILSVFLSYYISDRQPEPKAPCQLLRAVPSGGDTMDEKSVSKLFSGLSGEQQRKVKNILADKEQTERILSSPQARELLKKLMGGKEK